MGPHVCVYVKSRSIFTEICIRRRRASYLTRAKIEFSRAAVQYCIISSRSVLTFSLPASSCTRDTVCQLLCRHRNTTPGAGLGRRTDRRILASGPLTIWTARTGFRAGIGLVATSIFCFCRAHGRRVPSSVTAAAVAYPTQCRT